MKRYVRPVGDPRKTIFMVVVAASMMIFLDQFVLNPRPSVRPASYDAMIEAQDLQSAAHELDHVAVQEEERDVGEISHEGPQSLPATDKVAYRVPHAVRADQWRGAAVAAPASEGKAKIVIIIDDLGLGKKSTQEIVDLPGPLTLAYLPYASHLQSQVQAAHRAGHELMIHTPMEAVNEKKNPGPMALMEGMSHADMEATLAQVFDSFEGYVGINNHMGSRLTQDRAAMDVVMRELRKRGLIFVDSRTIGSSVAAQAAQEAGLYYAQRDVFLDHKVSQDFVRESLAHLEDVARRKGYAIAIGHPNKATISVLKAWLPTLAERGFVLVPVSDVVRSDGAVDDTILVQDVASVVADVEPAAGQDDDLVSPEEALLFGAMSRRPALLQSLPRE